MALDASDPVSHTLTNTTDAVAASILVSAPLWWQFIHETGHFILFALGLIYGILRIANELRVFRRGGRRK